MSILNKKDFVIFKKTFQEFSIFLQGYAVSGKKPLKKIFVWGIIRIQSKMSERKNGEKGKWSS